MEFRRPLIYFCLLMPALTAGCQQNHAARELLERELRLQEDRIYELEAELEDMNRAICSMKQDSRGGDLRDRSPVSTSEPPRTFANPGASSIRPPTTIGPPPSVDLGPPSVELPAPGAAKPGGASSGAAPKFLGPPAIVPPSVDLPEGLSNPAVPPTPPPAKSSESKPFKQMSSPKFLSPGVKANPVFDGPPAVSSSAKLASPPATTLPGGEGSTRIQTAALGRATRGINLDGAPGDDGVLVVVEARNARGDSVAPTADVSLVLIDPAIPGEGGRYARWDFTADDASALFRPANGDAGAGSYFELAWPDAPPAHARLRLFLRLTTPEGKQIQLDRDVTVDLAGGTSQYGAPPTLAPSPFAAPSGIPSTAFANVPGAAQSVVPAAAEVDANGEAGLRWGRREAEASTAAVPVEALPYEAPMPAAPPLFEPTNSFEAAAPTESPAGPLLFPADASFGSPDLLPRR